MKTKMSALLMTGLLMSAFLMGCMADDRNINEQPEDIGYFEPTRYDNNMDEDRRGHIDTDPRDVREPGEPDTPFNMDEEEPDPDEEPSEERRGQ
ncbi:hypothetical protein EQV77_09590 [Halobacillus fulvus]|nr:hypothetical protein EQV77_09590 [Halobacillus fulvus]